MVTRWLDTKTKSIDDAIEKILNSGILENNSSNKITYANLEANKILENNQTLRANQKEITFNVINYAYNQISSETEGNIQPIEDRTTQKSGFVIVYSDQVRVQYIISRNSDAQHTLRFLLGYSGKREIERNQIDFKSDFFIWLITLIFEGNNELESENSDKVLSIDDLNGFKGLTEGPLNSVSADGDTVMNILSTLSFLLETQRMKQVKISLKYGEHDKIELVLGSNSISTIAKNYSGIFEDDQVVDGMLRTESEQLIQAKIYLLCYLEILPRMIQTYQISMDEGNWNKEHHEDFLKEIAGKLQEKINLKIDEIGKAN